MNMTGGDLLFNEFDLSGNDTLTLTLGSFYYYECSWYSSVRQVHMGFLAIWVVFFILWWTNNSWLNKETAEIFHKALTVILVFKMLEHCFAYLYI
jgi:hypothetical protein